MPPKPLIRSILCFALALAVTACELPSGAPGSAPEPAAPTSTPFQPGGGPADPALAETLPGGAAATFTPYPTRYVKPEDLLPAQVIPAVTAPGADPSAAANPLTGLPFPDPALAQRRPIAIKIANAPDYVRPQSGLSLADAAYEYYIEWGDTRFIAVFYSADARQVGPVRSGRFFDEHILRMYHAFLVYKYSDPREKVYFYSSDFAPFLTVPGNTACPPFFVGKYVRDNYNNVFFDTTRFSECLARRTDVDNARQDLRSGFFSDEPQPSQLTGRRIYTDYSIYSYNYWEYDPGTRRYFRYQEANDLIKQKPRSYVPLTDALTGLPVTADNVVVIFAPHTFANQFEEEDEVYRIDPVSDGQAILFRDGVAYPARWYRIDIDQPLLLTDEEGQPLFLHPGRTFYQVIGESSSYSQDGVDWRFTFQTP